MYHIQLLLKKNEVKLQKLCLLPLHPEFQIQWFHVAKQVQIGSKWNLLQISSIQCDC